MHTHVQTVVQSEEAAYDDTLTRHLNQEIQPDDLNLNSRPYYGQFQSESFINLHTVTGLKKYLLKLNNSKAKDIWIFEAANPHN